MSYENDIKALISQMGKQYSYNKGAFNTSNAPGNFSGDVDQSPYKEGINNNVNSNSIDQSPINPINSVRPMNVKKVTEAKTIKHVQPGGCSQCGHMHPPIPDGTLCPMAPTKLKDEKTGKEIDVNKFLGNFKNILVSQIENNKIENVDKLFKDIIIEVTKLLETYK